MKHIPNIITSLNLFSGCMAVACAFDGRLSGAFCFILLAAVFDFLDGFVARLLGVSSPLGKELDSLSDLVSFGVAPAAMLFVTLQQSGASAWLAPAAWLVAVAAAWRLARFNLDRQQESSFTGLPTPAQALFWGGALHSYRPFFEAHPGITCALMAMLCLMMVSHMPMFSLKVHGLSWPKMRLPAFYLLGSVLLLAFMREDAVAPMVGWYILLSAARACHTSRKDPPATQKQAEEDRIS